MPTCEDATTPLEKYLTDEFCKIWRVLKATDVKLQAYTDATPSILSGKIRTAEDLESYVTSHEQSPDVQKTLNDKYARLLRSLINGLPERAPHTDQVLQALEDLGKPEEEVSF
jgi:hypothetical protein